MEYLDAVIELREKNKDNIKPCVAITQTEHKKLLDDSRMLKALIAAGARGTKIWNKAAQLIRIDFGQ